MASSLERSTWRYNWSRSRHISICVVETIIRFVAVLVAGPYKAQMCLISKIYGSYACGHPVPQHETTLVYCGLGELDGRCYYAYVAGPNELLTLDCLTVCASSTCAQLVSVDKRTSLIALARLSWS